MADINPDIGLLHLICAAPRRTIKAIAVLWVAIMMFCYNGTGQSMLEISLPAGAAGAVPTLERLHPAKTLISTDTFVANNGIYRLEIRNVDLPMTALIRSGGDKLREIFLSPGFPVTFRIFRADNKPGEKSSGPWRGLDSAFQILQQRLELGPYSAKPAAESPKKGKELSATNAYAGLLSHIDTALPSEYRPLKDFFVYTVINRAIDSSDEILLLNDYQLVHQRYLNQLAYGAFRNFLERKFEQKMNRLVSAQQGKPAPSFELKDSSGTLYRLQDYKGKLVYLDLWASWCMPCRLETPYMHRIMNRYSHRNDIVFIGIAVGDKLQDWKRAIRQDKPRWLQLKDNNNFVANAFAARSIPRYVLVDKQGNVLNFNAPSPSNPRQLAEMIDKALGI